MSHKIIQFLRYVLVFILWLVTTAVGLVEIVFVHQIFNQIYFVLAGYELDTEETFKARYVIGAVQDFSFVIIACLWVIFFVYSTYCHHKYADQKRSWRLFAWTAVVQALILVVNFVMPYLLVVD